jgi:2-alkyl-3-oxoalkanoate reductase
MRILVLGGSGFLGTALVPQLVERQHAVTVLTRSAATVARIEALGARALVGDLLAPQTFANNLAGIEAMVLIAQPPMFGRRIGARRFARLRAEVGRMHESALAMAMRAGCPIVLTAGTAFRTEGAEVADETWPLQRTGIARIGSGVDALLEQARAASAPKFVRLLPGQIYGPGGMFIKMLEMAKRGRNFVIGDGQNCIPRIHVDDCADAYVRAVEHLSELPSGEAFIVADDVACTTTEFASEMAACFGLPPPKRMPKPVRLVLRFVLGKYLLETMQTSCRVSNGKLRRQLGWAPRFPSFREGLRATAAALACS